MPDFYRGGTSLKPRPREVRIDAKTGLIRPGRGISVFDQPDGLERFGGANRIASLPPDLQIVQIGQDPHHYEISPRSPMSLDEYGEALQRIVLEPA
jgi:hypothetical protein